MGMSPAMRIVYGIIITAFGAIAALAFAAGSLAIPVAALVVGGLFAVSAPYVFGRHWRPVPPAPTRRPVRRRRR